MENELISIISRLKEVIFGEPWYGKSFNAMIDEIDPAIVYSRPMDNCHSIIDLVYHMITWSQFVQHQLEKDHQTDITVLLDWRKTNPEIHTWNTGIAQFTATNNKILELLEQESDELLDSPVKIRTYNFRYLLNGLIQHHVYHLGQIAYLNKLLNAQQLATRNIHDTSSANQ